MNDPTEPHTPGPWGTSRDAVPDGHVQITVYEEATSRRVATAFDREANAPLLSAAPDLLAACEAFLRAPSIGSSGPGSVTLEVQSFNLRAARDAIAKAKGC